MESKPTDEVEVSSSTNPFSSFDKTLISNNNFVVQCNHFELEETIERMSNLNIASDSDTTLIADEIVKPDHELILNNNNNFGLEEKNKPSTMATGKPKPSVASAKPCGVITSTKPVLLKNRPVATSTRTTTVSKSIAGTVNGTRTVPTSSSTSRAPLSSKPSTTHTVTARKPLSGITSTTGTRVKDTTRPPLTQPAAKVPAATITTKPVVKTTRTRTVPSSSSTTTSTRARTVPSTTTTTRTRTVQSTTTAVSKVGSIRSVATKSTAPTPSTRAVSKPANKMPSSTATNGVKAVPKKPITKVSDNKVTSSTSTVPSSTNGKPNVISIKRWR
ncbi:hypothetical protein RDWZM_007869 [Blomia tropicalis]|uniref:Uncharacterized protein n=1 Tax=Blomia tropicalis TaxID=40697 RepID=A0A9Q0M0P6_BLOTA|nr:hypothetical protein RDWZM_007869 [Blomia tropicalis]